MTDQAKSIPLTKGKFALVDPEDYERVSKFKWYARWSGWTWYAATDRNQTDVWLLHRLVMNAPDGFKVDHRDGNGLDCRRRNLRLATDSQNQGNRKKNANSVSAYKGVSRVRDKWRARIRIHGKALHIGVFTTEESAATAYNFVAEEHFGEFARLNVVGSGTHA